MDSDERKRLVAEARRMFEASSLGALGHVDRDMLKALLQTIDEAIAPSALHEPAPSRTVLSGIKECGE